jgi:hypothetical protein
MSTTLELRTFSKQILQALQQLDTLLDRVAGASLNADGMMEVAAQTQAVTETLTATRASLQAASPDGLGVILDQAKAKRAMAMSLGVLPLDPAIAALHAVPDLVEKGTAQGWDRKVLSLPLCLAYRHCTVALKTLFDAVDPQEISTAQ